MSLRLYNTRTRSVEPFKPVRDGEVRIYTCGLTPSAEAHLGHARSFMFFDVLRRLLVRRGFAVTYVLNVTDVDDRSIREAQETGVTFSDVVNRYYGSFKASMTRLHVLEPDREPRATAYIAEMIAMIENLIANGHAYVVEDGVYFSVSSFPRYGELSGRNTDELLIGARIAADEKKRDPLDFALWKFAKPGEPAWPSPWGDGRPGWHIECSAMSHALLGEPFDIHGGGYDLIFPHHENEIAQTESFLEDRGVRPALMANVWMHGGLLQFEGRKMSKSLGNFEPLSALLERHDAQAIRLLFLQTGYRKPMNFTEESIAGAAVALEKLLATYDLLRHAPPAPVPASGAPRAELQVDSPLEAARERFEAALDDDINTSEAVGILHSLAGLAGDLLARGEAAAAAAFMHEALEVLGLSPHQRTLARTYDLIAVEQPGAGVTIEKRPIASLTLPPGLLERLQQALRDLVAVDGVSAEAAIAAAIDARNAARASKDFGRADQVRQALAGAGIALADSKEGTTWSVAG